MTVRREFVLQRDEDVSGTSGVGVVAEGVEFSDGTCIVHWITGVGRSTAIHDNIDLVEHIHGHNGRTTLVFSPARPTGVTTA